MPKSLSAEQVRRYRGDGFVHPVPVMDAAEAARYRARFEDYERSQGGWYALSEGQKLYLLQTWVAELASHPRVLDAVEDVLGPDILVWGTSLFVKDAHDPAFVTWHQDATYWGLEPADRILTAWVALSDVPVESGAMKFLPGSHKGGQRAHSDTFHENNLLSRGQEIAVEVDEDEAADVVLKAGEFSLHHVLLAHGSHPNTTDQRRIGFAIRYLPTSARQTKLRDAAVLVRGVDEYGHFDLFEGPKADLDEAALAAHKDSTARLHAAVYSGTDKTEFRA